jgi:haloalkane dehalogenase
MARPTWLDGREYPFQSRYLDLPAGRLHYVDEGSGQPVVMVHGNPTWSFLYRHLIKELSPHYRCVAMDHLGFGLSQKPLDWSYRPQEHSRHVAALIEALDLQNITLVVQDWGGPIGLSYAIDQPQNVRRLVIINTWLWPVNDDWYYVAFSRFTGGAIGRFLIRRFNFFARVIMPFSFGDRRKLTRAIHEQYLQPLALPEERKGCWVLPGEILGAADWLAGLWDRRALLAEKPALIVWGMKDIAFREKELNTWRAALPAAEVVRLPQTGHYVQEEGADQLNSAVARFLAAA